MWEQAILFIILVLAPTPVSLTCAGIYLFYRLYFSGPAGSFNPFAEDDRKQRRPYITDQKARDAVLKQGFSKSKIPENLDAIVIGSGIGGLSTAAIMAKAGKKVLVLEQHDQAGGCCHTFIDKGYNRIN